MCRLLFVKKKEKFDIRFYLKEFANIAKNAKHDQSDGWGFCYLDDNNEWKLYKNVKPMWGDDLEQFDIQTKFLLAHVRDAFRLRTIKVENNMPFIDGGYAFTFNGNLKKVKVQAEGETGAHKIFNIFLEKIKEKGFDDGVKEAIDFIQKNTKYIKAMNLMISNKERTYVFNKYSEEEDFFQMHYNNDHVLVCSEKFLDITNEKISNGELMVVE